MTESLLQLRRISKSFGGVSAVVNLSGDFNAGSTIGLLGPNGAGKTTLFDIITGQILPDEGSIHLRGNNLTGLPSHAIARHGIARTFQEVRLAGRLTTLENILICFPDHPGERLGTVLLNLPTARRKERELRTRAMEMLRMCGLGEKAEEPAGTLSYGQQKLLSVMSCFATGASVMLLDEPINGLAQDARSLVRSSIQRFAGMRRLIIVIEQDWKEVRELCSRVLYMERGFVLHDNTPDVVLNRLARRHDPSNE